MKTDTDAVERPRRDRDALPISVCITTKNNSETIRRTLESVVDWTDEIVVVDSDSDDGTIEICEQYDADVYQHEFQGFAQIKRAAIDHASNEWVFVLDADETVPTDLRREIFENFGRTNAVAFRMRKREHMLGDWTHQYHLARPLLARKDVLYYQQEYLWERLSVKDEYADRTVDLSNHVNHYKIDRVSEMETKTVQYSALEALQVVERDKRDSAIALAARGLAVASYRLTVEKGFLDGYRGFFMAFMDFYQKIAAYAKIRDIRRLQREKPEEWRDIWLEEECQR